MPGSASGTSTLTTISNGLAPIASAASITPRLTSRITVSASRANSRVIATVSGTIAPAALTVAPTMARVNGMIAAIMMMNGFERRRLTIVPTARLTSAR